jgi:hypothetical protein
METPLLKKIRTLRFCVPELKRPKIYLGVNLGKFESVALLSTLQKFVKNQNNFIQFKFR